MGCDRIACRILIQNERLEQVDTFGNVTSVGWQVTMCDKFTVITGCAVAPALC